MQKVSFENMPCPIARSLSRVGEWWSMLILRDALNGMTRFDEFQKSLGIVPTMLTRRLTSLAALGLLERHQYSDHPPRYEYVPTQLGRDFRPVLLSLLVWGNRNFAPEGASVVLVDRRTGKEADPALVDRLTGQEIDDVNYGFSSGPAASEATRKKYGESSSARPAGAKRSATRGGRKSQVKGRVSVLP